MKQLTVGCKEFQFNAAFPNGSSSVVHSDYYLTLTNASGSSALLTHDLGWLPQGSRVEFSCDAILDSGDLFEIYIESRTGPHLAAGRKVAGRNPTDSQGWKTKKLTWIVGEGDNWITLVLGGSTADSGIARFRNPKITITENIFRGVVGCSIIRSGGTWVLDSTNFEDYGFIVESSAGENITISYPIRMEHRVPIPSITIDTVTALGAGGVNAGPHTILNNQLSIKLIKEDGTFVSDVTAGASLRLFISLLY